ncbi:MAG: ATP12 family protein [Pseudomonadota bacterium]
MSEWKAKRFWTTATVTEGDAGFGVALDGRSVKTPAKQTLSVPTRALAQAIAAEWDAQGEEIDPRDMPFTRTANAAIDKVALQHAEVAELLAAYGDSDLLCYRADAPEELVARQGVAWDPMLDWAADHLGVRLEVHTGVMHAAQPDASLKRLSDLTHAFSAFELAAFHDLVSLTGSLILGFAATRDVASAETIWLLSRVDELWQAEHWGEDEEAKTVEALKEKAFLHANEVFDLLGDRMPERD